MALRYAASVGVWCSHLLKEIGMAHLVRTPIRVYGDNIAANNLSSQHMISSGNQYIYVPYFWIQELVRDKIITPPMHVPTKNNIADLHTKSVDRQTVANLLPKLKGDDPTWTLVLTQAE